MSTILFGYSGALNPVAITMALQSDGHRVVGMGTNSRSVAAERYDAHYVVPLPDRPSETPSPRDSTYIDAILDICKAERVSDILSIREEEMFSLTWWNDRTIGNWVLEGNGINLICPFRDAMSAPASPADLIGWIKRALTP